MRGNLRNVTVHTDFSSAVGQVHVIVAPPPALVGPTPGHRDSPCGRHRGNVTTAALTSLSGHRSGAIPARPPPWRPDVAPHLVPALATRRPRRGSPGHASRRGHSGHSLGAGRTVSCS